MRMETWTGHFVKVSLSVVIPGNGICLYVHVNVNVERYGDDHPYPTRNSLFALVCVRINPGIISSVIYARMQLYMMQYAYYQKAIGNRFRNSP